MYRIASVYGGYTLMKSQEGTLARQHGELDDTDLTPLISVALTHFLLRVGGVDCGKALSCTPAEDKPLAAAGAAMPHDQDRAPRRLRAHATLPESRSASGTSMLAQLRRYARYASVAVVLEGESGTGKTSLAREIHEWSPRATGPFHAVPLSSLDDGLAPSALFGHVQGAYTDARNARVGAFASANGGTLFLDEIGKASLKVQHALLDAIESHVIRPSGSDRDLRLNIRIVAATSVPLRTLVDKGQFLDDLCARLDGFRVYVPALRERRADIPGFVHAIIAHHALECGYDLPPVVDDALMSVLQRAPWRYNLRELDATLHRMLIDAEGADRLTLDLCVGELADGRPKPRSNALLAAQEVEDVMKRAAGNKSAAARLLRVDRTTLYRTLEREKRKRADGA